MTLLCVWLLFSNKLWSTGSVDLSYSDVLYKDLSIGLDGLLLNSYLHLVYLVTPYDIISQCKPDWMTYFRQVRSQRETLQSAWNNLIANQRGFSRTTVQPPVSCGAEDVCGRRRAREFRREESRRANGEEGTVCFKFYWSFFFCTLTISPQRHSQWICLKMFDCSMTSC